MTTHIDAPIHPLEDVTREIAVNGQIRTIACRQGSSGIFTGDISGLYQGYRLGSTVPEVSTCVVDVPHGQLALVVTQQIVTPLPPRPAVHPFANGEDPFRGKPAGPPAGVPHGSPAGGPPAGVGAGPGSAGGPPAGTEGGKPIFKRVHYMQTSVAVDPDRSTGIFAGATGSLEVEAPAYRMPGYLVIDTDEGDLRLNFLEKGSRDVLNADLWVDGEHSTGRYAGATGTLRFSLRVTPPFYGEGTYSGVVQLRDSAR